MKLILYLVLAISLSIVVTINVQQQSEIQTMQRQIADLNKRVDGLTDVATVNGESLRIIAENEQTMNDSINQVVRAVTTILARR